MVKRTQYLHILTLNVLGADHFSQLYSCNGFTDQVNIFESRWEWRTNISKLQPTSNLSRNSSWIELMIDIIGFKLFEKYWMNIGGKIILNSNQRQVYPVGGSKWKNNWARSQNWPLLHRAIFWQLYLTNLQISYKLGNTKWNEKMVAKKQR